MQNIMINSQVTYGPQSVVGSVDTATIKNEPMLHRCTAKFAEEHGGVLTKIFLEELGREWPLDDILIDSRTHMLMPGWFPAIPGFHHDDVPRSLATKQPNYINPEYRSKHCMMLINADICPTEFAVGENVFRIPAPEEKTYKVWHEDVMQDIRSGALKSEMAPDKRLVFFDDRTWHQATPAVATGWRWFIRATKGSKLAARNEVRAQVQVYLDSLMEGW